MHRTLAMLVLFVVCSIPLVHADEFCWQLSDNRGNLILDFIRADVGDSQGGRFPKFPINHTQNAAPLYQLVGSGTAVQNTISPLNTFRVGLLSTHTTPGFFGGNQNCALTMILEGASLDGTWSMQCAGGPGGGFENAGLAHRELCAPLEFPSALAERQLETLGEYRAMGCDPTLPCLPPGQ
jgi:hypothetical protein